MTKKLSPSRIAPLQTVVAEPITDLAEQTALDEQRRRQGGDCPSGIALGNGQHTSTAAVEHIMESWRLLSPEERPRVLADLLRPLAPEQLSVVFDCLATTLAGPVLQQLEEELSRRLGK